MKSFTSLEQSKKLAEILPLESADACWTNHLFGSICSSWRVESTPPQEYKYLLDKFLVKSYLIEPAWSLAALLELLELPTLEKDSIGEIKIGWMVTHYDVNGMRYDTTYYNNPVDACVEMIIKLHELNLL